MFKKINPVQGIKETASQIQEQVADIADAAQEQFNAVLDQYQNVLPLAESLGLSVGKFEVHMGVLPEVKTSLQGSVEKIDKDVVNQMIAEYQDNKLLVLILNALILTKDLQKRFNISNLKGIVIDIKLGVPPQVSVKLG